MDDQRPAQQSALQRHAQLHAPVSDAPIVPGNLVQVFPSAQDTLHAMFDAIAAAQHHVHMEYYQFEDVHLDTRTLGGLLHECLGRGVSVTILYDAFGSNDAPSAFFAGLEKSGAHVQEFQPLSPFRRHFSLAMNFRDHRKILVVDGSTAFLGGVNMSRVYENPPTAGVPPNGNTKNAWWLDCAISLQGPVVARIQKLFLQAWLEQDDDIPADDSYPPLSPCGEAQVRVEASAPRAHRPLFTVALRTAIRGAQQSIMLSTGYFVPTRREWRLLVHAARRGVDVCLLLPGVSDVPGTVAAGRALYGRLMRAGVRIHQVRDGVLHAKAATIDGVWTAIGSSNFDRRSVVYNNEIDAIILGPEPALAVEAVLRAWMKDSEEISLDAWNRRGFGEKLAEHLARWWKRFM
jgi:cardiolipin synthase A/B